MTRVSLVLASCSRAFSVAVVAVGLLCFRFTVLSDSAVGYGGSTEPGAWLLGVRDLWLALALDVALLLAAVAMARVPKLRMPVRVGLCLVVLVQLVQWTAFSMYRRYLQGFQLEGLTVTDMHASVLSRVGIWNSLGLMLGLAAALSFARRGSLELSPVSRRTGMLWAALALSSALVAWYVFTHPHRFAVTARSPVLAFFQQEPDELAHLPKGKPNPSGWMDSGALAPEWSHLADMPRGHNVIILVLESVRAREAWPSETAAPMPTLAGLQGVSAVFTRAYAHEPRSIKGLEALLFGVYPTLSWKALSYRTGTLALDSVPAQWKALGLSTAFIAHADLEFDSQRQLLEGRGFDRIDDAAALDRFTPAGSDLRMVKALASFLDEAKGRRFGAMLWTRHTHLPYELPADADGQPPKNSLSAYRAAVSYSDRLIAELVALLKARGLFEDTVVVVTADHGESFGEHADAGVGHGAGLFEELVRVPLVLINPRLFHGERDDRVVQLKDVAATATWLAGSDAALNISTPIFFTGSGTAFTANFFDGFEASVIRGDIKYSFVRDGSANSPRERLVDLARDPLEERNLVDARREEAEALRSELFGWFWEWKGRWEAATQSPSDAQRILSVDYRKSLRSKMNAASPTRTSAYVSP